MFPFLATFFGCQDSTSPSGLGKNTIQATDTLTPELREQFWNFFDDSFDKGDNLSIVWQSDPSTESDYLTPILEVVLSQQNLFHKRVQYESESENVYADAQFSWLGKVHRIRSYQSSHQETWTPEYTAKVVSWMTDDRIWFVTSETLSAPPSDISDGTNVIRCTEHDRIQTFYVSECTLSPTGFDIDNRMPISSLANTTNKSLEEQIQVLNQNILRLTEALYKANPDVFPSETIPTSIEDSPYSNLAIPALSDLPSYPSVTTDFSPAEKETDTETDTETEPKGSIDLEDPTEPIKLEMYLSKDMARPGDTIQIFISSPTEKGTLKVFKNTATGLKEVTTVSNVKTSPQTTSSEPWLGAQWKETMEFNIPKDWESDLYFFQIRTKSDKYNAGLVIHNPTTKHDGILVLENNLTRHAYNNWGGKSLYGYNSSNSKASKTVSNLRPTGGFKSQTIAFDRWIETQGYSVDYATMDKFDKANFPLDEYKVVAILGHNEYWSLEGKAKFDKFIASGGHAIVLSGNTLWWETVSQNNLHTVEKKVPEAQNDTLHFGMKSITESLGVNFNNAGYITDMTPEMVKNGNRGFVVHDQKHWTLSESKIEKGSTFGEKFEIAGYEVDGADLQWELSPNGMVNIGQIPERINVIAYALSIRPDKELGLGTVVTYQRSPTSGCVFNAGSIQWADGIWNLKKNAVIKDVAHQVTKRVVTEFMKEKPMCIQ